MAQNSGSDHAGQNSSQVGDSFPYGPVIFSAVVLIALGAFILNLAVSGSLPTGFGVGDALPANMVAGVDLDIVRGIIIVIVLAGIALGSLRGLRNQKN